MKKLALACLLLLSGASYTLRVRGVPLGTVLNILANQAGKYLVLDPLVDPTVPVTVDIYEAPLERALEILLTPLDLYYEIEGDRLAIRALRTQVFEVDFLAVSTQSNLTIGGDVIGGGGARGGFGAAAGAAGGARGAGGGAARMSGSFQITYQSAVDSIWRQLEENIRALLSEDGTVTVDPVSGLITVTDRPSRLQRIGELVERYRALFSRSILIEAKIVEVSLSQDFQYGIDFTRIFGPSAAQTQVTYSQQLAPGTGTAELTYTTIHSPGQNVLRALETAGTVRVLASPRLRVLNGQSALLNIGEIIPFISEITTTITQGVATTSFSLSQAQSGILFGITPRINEDDTITLLVLPIVTDIREFRTFQFEGTTIEAPVVSTRGANTVVRVRPGETLAIGGLIQESSSVSVRKVPLLGDLPGLGSLFRSKDRSTQKTEVVILITPLLTDHSSSSQETSSSSSSSMRSSE